MANKQKKELLISILQISTTAFLLNGCNSSVGNTNINVSKLSPALQSQKLNVSGDNKMNIHWTVDNRGEETSLNSALQDSAWHLLTLTVKSITPNLQPTKVEGILSGIIRVLHQMLGKRLKLRI